jgi:hypothetical protein
LPFVVQRGEEEEVTARAGLPLIVEALRGLGLDEEVSASLQVAKRQRGFSELDKLEALITIIAAGGDRVEDIQVLAEDKGLMRLLDRTFPSPDALLDFLYAFDDPSAWEGRPPDEASWVPPENEPLAALADINVTLVERASDRKTTTATIDHDGTIIESHKRTATVAYEGTKGYQPLVALWAEEDLIIADEFRNGNVPGGKDPLSSVKRAFDALPAWVERRYFRADSADYYTPLLKYLVKEQISFSISADMSPELRACCTALSEESWDLLEKRERELAHVAEVEFTPGDWPKNAAPLRYVALRLTPKQQEFFEERGPKYLAVVTNRAAPPAEPTEGGTAPTTASPEPMDDERLTAKELVRWHWGKAGTVEHINRVLKDELGAGVLPSQKFGANAAWFRINVLTHNLLAFLRRRVLPERYRFARPKRLRFDYFTLPGRLAAHQRQLTVNVSAGPERTAEIIEARQRLLAMREDLARRE